MFRGLWDLRRSAAAGAIGGACVVLSVGVVYAASLLTWIEVHDKLAAWVQAVFSVVAIGAAIWIERASHRRERRVARDARMQKLAVFRNLAAVAMRYVNETASSVLTAERDRFERRRDSAITALEAIPLHEITQPELIFQFTEMRLHNRRYWEEFMKPQPLYDEETIVRRCQESQGQLIERLAAIDAVLVKHGFPVDDWAEIPLQDD